MDVQPDQHLLEIGCGVGMAVEQIVPLLKTGKISAIDRSPSMIAKAVKRNAAGIQHDKAAFITTDLPGLSGSSQAYDTIFSSNVNFFWTNKSIQQEAALIKAFLKKKGTLYVFYGPLFAGGLDKVTGPAKTNLEREGFSILEMVHDKKLQSCGFVVRMK